MQRDSVSPLHQSAAPVVSAAVSAPAAPTFSEGNAPDSDADAQRWEDEAPRSSHEYEARERAQAPAPRGEIFEMPATPLVISPLSPHDNAPDSATPQRGWGWLLAALLVLYSLYFFAWTQGFRAQKPLPVGPIRAQNAAPRWIKVHVAGAVLHPGVYTLPAQARIQDALKKAGGALPKADANALNLADWAVDGSKIEVPNRTSAPVASAVSVAPTPTIIVKEVAVTPPLHADATAATETARSATHRASSAISAPAGALETPKTPAAPAKSSAQNLAILRRSPIDLNRASADELQKLPGVGPKMAERILAYRAENGGFKSVDDLDSVRGIGEKRMETLKTLVKIK